MARPPRRPSPLTVVHVALTSALLAGALTAPVAVLPQARGSGGVSAGGLSVSGGGSPTRGDLIVANSTPAWAKVAVGAAGTVFTSNGTDPSYTTSLSLAATSNQIVLQSTGVTGTISWTPATSNKTFTIPNVTGTAFTGGGANSYATGLGAIAQEVGPSDAAFLIRGGANNSLQLRSGNVTSGTAPDLQLQGGLSNTAGEGGSIVFNTAASGSGDSASERLRVQSSGRISFGGTSSSFPAFAQSGAALTHVLADGTSSWATRAIDGGTGQIIYTAGDLLYASSTTALSRLAVGGSGTALVVSASTPTWSGGNYGCVVYNSGSQTITTGTWTTATFDTEWHDPGTQHSTVSNTGRITFGVAGTYYVVGTVTWASNATGFRAAAVDFKGASYWGGQVNAPGSGGDARNNVSAIVNANATDYVELRVHQTSGGDLAISSQYFGAALLVGQ